MKDSGTMAGLVLAGGRSSRFGADKGMAELGGRSLMARAVARLEPQVSVLAINSNDMSGQWDAFGLPVIGDLVAGFAGPLAGVSAGLQWAQNLGSAECLLTVPLDTPFFPEDLAARLLQAAQRHDGIAFAASNSGTHPAFALWPLRMAGALADYVGAGGRKMHDFLAESGAVSVAFPDVRIGDRAVDPFFNINTPDDLAEARRLLQGV